MKQIKREALENRVVLPTNVSKHWKIVVCQQKDDDGTQFLRTVVVDDRVSKVDEKHVLELRKTDTGECLEWASADGRFIISKEHPRAKEKVIPLAIVVSDRLIDKAILESSLPPNVESFMEEEEPTSISKADLIEINKVRDQKYLQYWQQKVLDNWKIKHLQR